ncbi:MAG: SUMF1/EgtB/PvdO family nonheme iron enzyme [Myxococcota bacterium]
MDVVLTLLTPGALLEGRYEVIELVGSGTFARVYSVRHVALRSLHAVKVLDERYAQIEDVRARFLAEGRIQAQLRHPHLVGATDILTTPVSGLVMELVEGPSLRGHLETLGRRMTLSEALEVLLPVLDAVDVAHRAGIIHRDLKPENVLLARDAATSRGPGRLRPMVTDFGIAKVIVGSALATGKQRMDDGLRVGTLHYMSPEQVRGGDDVGPETDTWAIGVLLYELLTGHLPFEADTEYDTMRNIVSGAFHPPEAHIPGLSPGVCDLLRRALALSPSARFPSCGSLHIALERALVAADDLSDDEATDPGRGPSVVPEPPAPIVAPTPPVATQATPVKSQAPPIAKPAVMGKASPSRSAVYYLLLGAVALGAVGIVATFLYLAALGSDTNPVVATPLPSVEVPVSTAALTPSAPLTARYPMVSLSPRRFTMGSPPAEAERWKDETPHPVALTGSLLVGVHEVDQALWADVMGTNPSAHVAADRPVEGVTWYEAVDFCNRLSTREGLVPAYVLGPPVVLRPNADGYRLPTEAEWEAAARADATGGSAPDAFAGSTQVGEVAWYDRTSAGAAHPVGALRPNGLGLYDMSGNVSEWTWDAYADYPADLATDPVGANDGETRIHRGGSWNATARAQRVAYRRAALPTTRSSSIGLRLVRPVSSATPPGR